MVSISKTNRRVTYHLVSFVLVDLLLGGVGVLAPAPGDETVHAIHDVAVAVVAVVSLAEVGTVSS